MGTGPRETGSGLYYLPAPVAHVSSIPSVADVNLSEQFAFSATAHTTELWHRRLAHMGYADLLNAKRWTDGIPSDLDSSEVPVCGPCRQGKAHALPFAGHFKRATRVGQIVHSDIAGPLPPSYDLAYRYMVTFTDDCARHTSVGFLKRKSHLRQAFEQFKLQLADLVDNDFVAVDELHTADAEDFATFLGGRPEFRIVRLHSDQAQEYKTLEKSHGHLATYSCLLYTSPSPRDKRQSRMPSSA